MTIVTKFDYNQKCWFINPSSAKAECLGVYEIMINCYSHSPTIRYKLNRSDGPIFDEGNLFPTKEDLLKSL